MDVTKTVSDSNSCYLTNCELLELAQDYVLSEKYGISCSAIDYRLVAKHYLNLLADECFTYKISTKDPLPPLPEYYASYTDYVCQMIEIVEVTDYSAQYSDYVCQRTEVLLYDVDAQFTDYVCERKLLADPIADFQAYFTEYVCERRSTDVTGYNAEFAEYICERYNVEATYEAQYADYICEREEVVVPLDTTILEFDVDNSVLEGFSQFRMDFETIGGYYGVVPDAGMIQQRQDETMQQDEYFAYKYALEAGYIQVQYNSTGTHHVKIQYEADGTTNTLQEAKDACHSLIIYDLKVTGNLDISSYKNLQTVDIQQANIPVLTLPETVNNHVGLNSFTLYKVSGLPSLNLSNISIPVNIDSLRAVKISVCPHIQTLNLFTGRAAYEISENSQLTSITFDGTAGFESTYFLLIANEVLTTLVNFNGSPNPIRYFRMDRNTMLPYDDFVNKFPMLTHINGYSASNPAVFSFMDNGYNAATVNKILADLDKNSVAGFNYRKILLTGNAAPDSTSGIYDGISAKTSLIRKGFSVQTA